MPLELPKSPTTTALSLAATDMNGNTSNYSICFPLAAAQVGDGIKNGSNP